MMRRHATIDAASVCHLELIWSVTQNAKMQLGTATYAAAYACTLQ